jgi:hypothetical protein
MTNQKTTTTWRGQSPWVQIAGPNAWKEINSQRSHATENAARDERRIQVIHPCASHSTRGSQERKMPVPAIRKDAINAKAKYGAEYQIPPRK